MKIEICPELYCLGKLLRDEGATAYLVGGAVRDIVFDLCDPKDYDVEVHGISKENLQLFLEENGDVKETGKRFGVFKFRPSWAPDNEYDVAVPRLENKTGVGHRGVDVEHPENISLLDAAIRRDFTMNSMYANLLTGDVIDLFGGARDFQNVILAETSAVKFSEDPVRPLRAAMFCARYLLYVSQSLVHAMRGCIAEFPSVSKEEVWNYWKKILSSEFPGAGLDVLHLAGFIEKFYPELFAMIGCVQDECRHPEGDVFQHTMKTMNAMAMILGLDDRQATDDDIVMMLAAMLHDVAKPKCTKVAPSQFCPEEDIVTSHGHDDCRTEVESMLRRIGAPESMFDKVVALCENHMFTVHAGETPTTRAVRRLARKLGSVGLSVNMLACLIDADMSGRDLGFDGSRSRGLRSVAGKCNATLSAPKPILQGRHLIERGLQPGKQFSVILKKALEAQDDGAFMDFAGAQEWLSNELGVDDSSPEFEKEW